MESRSNDCAAGSAVQFTLRTVPLHAPLAACRTWWQALLTGLDAWPRAGLLLIGLEPALLRSLHLGHRTTMLTRTAATQEVARRRNISADGIIRDTAIAGHALHGRGSRGVRAFMRSQAPRGRTRGGSNLGQIQS